MVVIGRVLDHAASPALVLIGDIGIFANISLNNRDLATRPWPAIFAVVVMALVAVARIVSVVHVRRATRINPTIAFRREG